jgi:conjugal transfer pilus assembly protein TraW
MVRILGIVLMISGSVHAKDFGVQGTTYPVAEDSLLEHLRQQLSKLSPEALRLKQLDVQKRVKQSVINPTAVQGIQKVTTFRTFTFDPSITLEKDIVDHHGNIIAAKGTRYNPLATIQLKDSIILFDETDPEQVKWAIKHGDHTKWILTQGRPFELMKQYDRAVYFDQGGAMCKHFNITAIPVLIRQKGHLLQIEEGIGDDHAN